MSRSYDPYAAADNPASDYYEPYTTSTPGPNKRGYTRYDWGGTGSNASAEPPGYDYEGGRKATGSYDDILLPQEGYGYSDFSAPGGRKRPLPENPYDDYYQSAAAQAQRYYGRQAYADYPPLGGGRQSRFPPPEFDPPPPLGGGGYRGGSAGGPYRGGGAGRGRGGGGGRGGGPGGKNFRPDSKSLYSTKSLYQVLKYPTDKQVWVEGTKSDGTTKYFYNPLTSKAAPKPPDGSNIAIMQQMDLAEKLDQYQPATFIIRGKMERLNEPVLERYFQTFGQVHFIKVAEQSALYPSHAFVRMQTILAQSRLLAHRGPHFVGGQQIKIVPPYNRILVSRIPMELSKMDLLRFFSDEARKIDPEAYIIDAYRPMPFTQFAFIVFGERGNVAELFGKKVEMTFGDEYTVSCVHTPHNAGAGVSSGITGQQSEGKGMTERKSVVSQPISEDQVSTTFSKKVHSLHVDCQAQKAVALEAIQEEVEGLMKQMLKSKASNSDFDSQTSNILKIIGETFAFQTDDKLRKYVLAQEHVFALCQQALGEDEDEDADDSPNGKDASDGAKLE